MILLFHIVFAVSAVVATTALMVAAARNKSTLLAQRTTLLTSSLTILSGGVLILQGGSIVRICAEAGLLIVGVSVALAYARRQQKRQLVELH